MNNTEINLPLVSVIVPVYNTAKYLRQCLDSILTQTYTNFEIICVNDGSTDNSLEILNEYKVAHPSKVIIISQVNKGLSAARNTGIAAALKGQIALQSANWQSQYIAFLDSDDVYFSTKLEEHVNHFLSDETLGMSYSWSQLLDEEDNWINSYQMADMRSMPPHYWLYRNPPGNGSTPVIRTACLGSIGFLTDNYVQCWFSEDMKRAEDIECWLRIALTTEWKMEGIPKVLTGYRVNSLSLSANVDKQYESWHQVMTKVSVYAPTLVKQYYSLSKAFMCRYLARRSMELNKPKKALYYLLKALVTDVRIFQEFKITCYVILVVTLSNILPHVFFKRIKHFLLNLPGRLQQNKL